MTKRRTTICCSAFALIQACPSFALAQTTPKAIPPIAFKTSWTIALGGSLAAPPAFDNARGYFPLDDGRLVAFDLTIGAELWTTRREIHSQPAAGGGLVFFVEEGALAAVHARDGSIAWRQPFSEFLAVPIVFDNGWLVAAAKSGAIFAFRASDGALIWQQRLGAPARARPALAADRVYVPSSDQRILALSVKTGEPVWERRLGGPPNDILALDDRIYAGSDDNYLYCLKASDGLIDWRWPTGGDVVGLPVADARMVFFVSLDNLLRGLDRKSGNQRWKRALPLRPTTGPLKAGDALIVSGIAPMLRAYFTKDGAPAGDTATDGELAASPFFLDDTDAAAVIVVTRTVAKGAVLSALSRTAPPAAAPVSPPANQAPTVPPAPPTPGA